MQFVLCVYATLISSLCAFFVLLFSSFSISVLGSTLLSFQSLVFYPHTDHSPSILFVLINHPPSIPRHPSTCRIQLAPRETVASFLSMFRSRRLWVDVFNNTDSSLFLFPSCPCFVRSSCTASFFFSLPPDSLRESSFFPVLPWHSSYLLRLNTYLILNRIASHACIRL